MADFRVAFMFSIALLLFIIAAGGYSPSSTVDIEFDVGQWMVPSTTLSSCQGTIGECFEGDDQEEFLLDSESNRRILASRRYISYGALRRNHVPCSRRGASYYNCRPGAAANPYRRGCSRITRCRR
uniref:Uncharacterized protein n=1 Tax=Chenopodium quinoa TaxID=63459 RepID=A0A803MM40_CHEQI